MIFSTIFYIYLLIGLVFSIYFFFKGLKKVDATASQSSLLTKAFWLPGIILLWPLLLKNVLRNK